MKQTILVIEDHLETQDLIRNRLEKRGYTPVMVENAAQGIAMAHDETIQLILMDLDLPGLNGLEATELLKTLKDTRHIPIIAVSANIDDRAKDKLDEIGFDGYCLKPIDFERLFRIVSSFLSHKAS